MKHFVVLCVLIFARASQAERQRRGLIETNNDGFFDGVVGELVMQQVEAGALMVVCSAYNTSVAITADFFDNLDIKAIDDVVFLDDEGKHLDGCRLDGPDFKADGASGILPQFGDCARSVENRDGYVCVNYTLCVVPGYQGGVYISRDKSVTIDFSCKFNQTIYANDIAIYPRVNKVEIEQGPSEGSFEIVFSRCQEQTCNLQHSSNIVLYVPDEVFIELSITNGDTSSLVLQMQQCWATPTADSADTTSYEFINGGCAEDDPNNEIYRNFESYNAIFGFNSFLWTNMSWAGQSIYIHCRVCVCENALPESNCTDQPVCPSRRRRSLYSPENSKLVSYGPFLLRSRNRDCDELSLGCSYGCGFDSNGEEVCICPEGYSLASDGKTCTASNSDISRTEFVEIKPHETGLSDSLQLTFLLLVGLLSLCCFVMIQLRGRKATAPSPMVAF